MFGANLMDNRSHPLLDPRNKIEFHEGDRVEFTLDGNVSNLLMGTVVGISTRHLIDYWIIQLDEKLPEWEYSCVTIQHTMMRPLDDNRPFLCEGVSRV
jgi:hypothetical protein